MLFVVRGVLLDVLRCVVRGVWFWFVVCGCCLLFVVVVCCCMLLVVRCLLFVV